MFYWYLWHCYFQYDFEEENFEEAKTNYKKGSAICAPDYDLVTLNIAYGLGRIEEAAENYTEAIRLLKQGLDDYQVTPQEDTQHCMWISEFLAVMVKSS